jgi:hypothetical protein
MLPTIWMYWENKDKNTKRPAFLDLCFITVKTHCSNDFNVVLLNEHTVYQYLPNLRKDLDRYCSIPQKTDYIRLSLLKTYGGIWLDADMIIFKSLMFYFKLIKDFDYIGFGCNYDNCNVTMNGLGRPANWLMMSRKNGKLVTYALRRAEQILNQNPSILQKNYHRLGKDLLFESIVFLNKNDKKFSYYHVPSLCLERQSDGSKLLNDYLLSNKPIDPYCIHKMVIVPIYNTAPGFPPWFKKMTKEEILRQQNMLISKLFRFSLKI